MICSEDFDEVLRGDHNDDVADEHIVHCGTCLNLPEADPSGIQRQNCKLIISYFYILYNSKMIQRQNCKLANFDHHLLLVMLSMLVPALPKTLTRVFQKADPSSDPSDPKAELQTLIIIHDFTCDPDHAGGDDHFLIINWIYSNTEILVR